MKNIIWSVLFCFFNLNMSAQTSAKMEESLIIFLQAEDTLFQNQVLPKIKVFTAENNLKLILKNVDDGVPANITTTPAIVYQNYKGRSIYASRYMEFSTIKNFIRTSRVIPQRVVENCLDNQLVWETGRAKIVAPLKITDVAGKLPKGFSQRDFKEKAKTILSQKMANFKRQDGVCLQKTDRLFYLDLHPYRNADNEFFLSLEMYAQYSCKDPVFSKMNVPLKGDFDNWETLLAEAATIFEKEIMRQLKESLIGDACTPILKNAPIATWTALNLTLPEAPEKAVFDNMETIEMPQKWTFYQAIDEATPIVQFRFMAPLDRYVGEIRKISGNLEVVENQGIAKGAFVAEMQSLTMGMESFDYNVLNKYVKAYKIPESSFTFETSENLPELTFGETTQFSVEGTFELMRKKRPVQVNATLTPLLDAAGQPILQVSASFSLNVVDDFGIKGPDGPDPARKTMLFDLNFLMKP